MTVFERILQIIFYVGALYIVVGCTYLLYVKVYDLVDFILNIAPGLVAFILAKDGKIVLFNKR